MLLMIVFISFQKKNKKYDSKKYNYIFAPLIYSAGFNKMIDFYRIK